MTVQDQSSPPTVAPAADLITTAHTHTYIQIFNRSIFPLTSVLTVIFQKALKETKKQRPKQWSGFILSSTIGLLIP